VTDAMVLAYIDPGSGAILLQMVIGSVVGVAIFFRQSVVRLFNRLRGNRAAPADDTGSRQ
jgi:hypothetical protein